MTVIGNNRVAPRQGRPKSTRGCVSSATRRGFSLVELLCVIGLLVLLMGMLTVLLLQTLDLDRAQRESSTRMLQHAVLADQFRADVASAEQAPAEWEQHKASTQSLILQMKNGQHVLYSWQNGKLERRSFENGKESSRPLPVGDDQVGVVLVLDGSDAKLVRLRLSRLRDGVLVPGQVLEIAAALGGDWR
jgi:prepilin-type N-terminal cleavage/methylation domain-containing protein